MGIDDIIFIVLLIIFFIGPLIRKVIEAANEATSAQKKQSYRDIHEYLQKMRELKEASEKGKYRAPATRPPTSHKKHTHKKKEKKLPEEKRVEVQSASSYGKEMQKKEGGAVIRIDKASERLEELVMTNPKFSDLQRAIILTEIFSKPKALR